MLGPVREEVAQQLGRVTFEDHRPHTVWNILREPRFTRVSLPLQGHHVWVCRNLQCHIKDQIALIDDATSTAKQHPSSKLLHSVAVETLVPARSATLRCPRGVGHIREWNQGRAPIISTTAGLTVSATSCCLRSSSDPVEP